MSDYDIRMQEYERKEQDFLQFINQSRREREEPLTPESCANRRLTAPTKGLQCLLALSRLLEQTVNVTITRINSQKDLTDLLELRRQAERMGHGDSKGTTNHHEKLNGDSLSLSDEHQRFFDEPNRTTLAYDQNSEHHSETHKGKSLKTGAQMLTGTLGKVKTKLMKTTGNHRDSNYNTSPSSSTTGFAQRKLGKVHDTTYQPQQGITALIRASSNDLLRPLHTPLSVRSSDSEIVRNSVHFEQRQLLTPPTPPDLGDIWLGTDTSNSEKFIASNDAGKRNSLSLLSNSNPSSPQVTSNEFEKAFVTRRMSEYTPTMSQVQEMDRFTSLPDHLEMLEPGQPATVEVQMRNNTKSATKKSRVTHRPSYEEAVAMERCTFNEAPSSNEHSRNSSFDVVDCRTQSMPLESLHSPPDAEYIRNLNLNMSKDFAKKFEQWVGKGKSYNKDSQSKSKHQPNQPPKTKTHKRKGGKQFHRQRSMSADRGAMLISRANNEFEEKLRQWGIKQAHDPNYYLVDRRRSREEKRSAESPARLSRRDEKELVISGEKEVSPIRSSLKKDGVEKTTSSSSVSSQSRRSIERGRRVSPTRHKTYSRSSHGSYKSSSDAISSSSSGSSDPINQLSPQQLTKESSSRAALKSISADSLLSVDSVDLEDGDEFNRPQSLQRPLSMIGMRGSLEASEAISPGMQSAAPWSSDSQLLSSSCSKDMLKTIKEDISKIRERKARMSDSSSDNSLEGSFRQIPTSSPQVLTLNVPCDSADRMSDDPSMYTRLNSNIENPAVELPSYSICVDSGMEMEEGEFRADLTHDGETGKLEEVDATASPTTIDNKPETLPTMHLTTDSGVAVSNPSASSADSCDKQSNELSAASEVGSTTASLNQPVEEVNETVTESLLSVELEIDDSESSKTTKVQPNLTKTINDNTEILEETTNSKSSKFSLQQSKSEDDYIIVDAKLITIGESGSPNSSTPMTSTEPNAEVKELTNQPLEPLLSSQSVSLKTKLQRLSSLYDHDDGEDMMLKPEEPSGPYDVFKAPNKCSRSRSRSHDGLLNDDTENQKPKLVTKGSVSGLFVKTDKEDTDLIPNKSTTSTREVSPLLRKKLHSPVPVLNLVQKFDSQKSNSSSPATSPTQPAPPPPQMGKIADRLLQVKANKTNRFTVDLSRHVREIPKEGAVQRARSIFMDMK